MAGAFRRVAEPDGEPCTTLTIAILDAWIARRMHAEHEESLSGFSQARRRGSGHGLGVGT